ncbi:hypothetical protein J6590_068403 [Homalodisca vitripennis]|nr:hypothetical protein J6590_068403 [Homalodisca vitripennis]
MHASSLSQTSLDHGRSVIKEIQQGNSSTANRVPPPSFKNCIQLAACSADQILPMNPDLPADIFTSCLTTPIKIALRWFVMQNQNRLEPRVTLDLIDKIPGQLSDRRTMLGELNWIFTAITDTIAWNTLPRGKMLFPNLPVHQKTLSCLPVENFLVPGIPRGWKIHKVGSCQSPRNSQRIRAVRGLELPNAKCYHKLGASRGWELLVAKSSQSLELSKTGIVQIPEAQRP